MILSSRQILTAIADGDIVVEPFRRDCLGTNSYDVHLGKTLRVYKTVPIGTASCVDMISDTYYEGIDAAREMKTREITIDEHEGILLRPGMLYLAVTEEYTETHKHVPNLDGKSSTGRLGLQIHLTAGRGDVGFCNHWTMELSVVQPLRVYAGMPIGQLKWEETGPVEVPYNKKPDAKYTTVEAKPQPSKMFQNLRKRATTGGDEGGRRWAEKGVGRLEAQKIARRDLGAVSSPIHRGSRDVPPTHVVTVETPPQPPPRCVATRDFDVRTQCFLDEGHEGQHRDQVAAEWGLSTSPSMVEEMLSSPVVQQAVLENAATIEGQAQANWIMPREPWRDHGRGLFGEDIGHGPSTEGDRPMLCNPPTRGDDRPRVVAVLKTDEDKAELLQAGIDGKPVHPTLCYASPLDSPEVKCMRPRKHSGMHCVDPDMRSKKWTSNGKGYGSYPTQPPPNKAEMRKEREERDALEERIETAYWRFDTSKGGGMSDRDAFKGAVRNLLGYIQRGDVSLPETDPVLPIPIQTICAYCGKPVMALDSCRGAGDGSGDGSDGRFVHDSCWHVEERAKLIANDEEYNWDDLSVDGIATLRERARAEISRDRT